MNGMAGSDGEAEEHHSLPRPAVRMSKAMRVSKSSQARQVNAWSDINSFSDRLNGMPISRAQNQ
jgi:hypothetical protein